MKTIARLLLALALVIPVFGQIEKNSLIKVAIVGVDNLEQQRINADYPVDGNGNINLWQIGDIRAAGLSPEQLARKIEAAYVEAEIYSSPTFQVYSGSKKQEITEQVTIAGKVAHPGPIPWTKGMTLAKAIAAGGGPNTFGTTKRVFLYRDGTKTTYSPLTNDSHKLIPVKSGDTIEVDQVKAWESGSR